MQLKRVDLLAGDCIPHVDAGPLALLAGDNLGAVATDVEANNIIAVADKLVSVGIALLKHLDLFAAVYLLRTVIQVLNHAQCCTHVNGLALRLVAKILLAVECFVAENVLNFECG